MHHCMYIIIRNNIENSLQELTLVVTSTHGQYVSQSLERLDVRSYDEI